MRIAIIHYHLKRGGVTSVILNQARCLVKTGAEVLIISGEEPDGEFKYPLAVLKELSYDRPEVVLQPAEIMSRAEKLADDILRVTEEHWGASTASVAGNGSSARTAAGADIIHIHNPLIQKNSLLIPAIKILGEKGAKLFLQNHDLAEDFRPDVYTGAVEYPKNCHYGVINSRDYDFLCRAGLKPEGLHLIPNEVFPLKADEGLKRTRYLYPVRAIRRKNIGEAILLSLFIPAGTTVALTLPPSEKDSVQYRRWLSLAAELELPVEFALGQKYSLSELLGTSVCALTTSVKEGFGFSFLEPWTANLGLFGRHIDYVCRDFEQAGVNFDHLYSSLEIPSQYIPEGLAEKTVSAMRRIYSSFSLEMPGDVIRTLTEDLASRSSMDFGRLDEEFQEKIIRTVYNDKKARLNILDTNPDLNSLQNWMDNDELISENCAAIAVHFGERHITESLMLIYKAVMERRVVHQISKSELLKLYLDPLRLFLVGISDG